MIEVATRGATLAATDNGGTGPALVFAHGLGLDHSIWASVTAQFADHRIITYDLRGHGASSVPDGPYSMGQMVADAEAICDHFSLRDVCFVGLSIGGMIAQGLAVKRLDLVRAMVLCSSAAKNGQPEPWHDRATTARVSGLATLLPATFERWNEDLSTQTLAQTLLTSMSAEGYAATCEAIAGTDFYTPTSGLRLPTMGLCGTRDRATPPDLVRETTELVPGSTFHLIHNAGHLPPLSQPDQFANLLQTFLTSTGHTPSALR